MKTVSALALVVIASLCGMLLCGGVWDIVFFIIAALPLAWGVASAWKSLRLEK